jgi:hypothetical protein
MFGVEGLEELLNGDQAHHSKEHDRHRCESRRPAANPTSAI